jgi:hypothetical protein
LYFLLFIDGLFFNFFSPITHEFQIYKAICNGWVFRPGKL